MRVLDQVPEELWNDVAKRCAHATFFHTFAWADAFQKSYPEYRIVTKAFEFGADDWVVFPMMQTGIELKGFFKYYISSEPGVYGGPIFNREPDREKLKAILAHFQNYKTVCLKIHGNPLFNLDGNFADCEKRPNATHMLDLSEYKSMREVFERYERGTKKGIRSAEDQKVECALMEDPAQLEECHKIYWDVICGWGSKATSYYEAALFKNLFAKRGEGVKFWLAKYYGKTIGATISCEHNRHLSLWLAFWNPLAHEIGAGKFVYNKIIEYAMAGGIRYFDFNPSGGHQGTVRLKETFGCAKKEFFDYVYESNNLWNIYAKFRGHLLGNEDKKAGPD